MWCGRVDGRGRRCHRQSSDRDAGCCAARAMSWVLVGMSLSGRSSRCLCLGSGHGRGGRDGVFESGHGRIETLRG